MIKYDAGKCDVAVIGAGHAGIEAALAAARLGLDTVCFTVNLDSVGNMPCNPAIGGTGKGHLVRELDALGGEMAKAADRACIQYRMLNLGKGPAVHSLRAQADRRRYQEIMKHTLELQENLRLKQAEGVGRVEVMLSLASDMEYVYASEQSRSLDESSADGGTSSASLEESTKYASVRLEDGSEALVVLKRVYPEYKGAVVVCDGADHAGVRLKVINAVSALTGLSSDRITVMKMK